MAEPPKEREEPAPPEGEAGGTNANSKAVLEPPPGGLSGIVLVEAGAEEAEAPE